MIQAAGLSDIGRKRASNEDRILVEPHQFVFVVADGMGGERCGERAAEMATRSMAEYFRDSQDAHLHMETAIRLANETILRESIESTDCRGMGCTISAVSINGNVATVGNVGDSRVYLFRADKLVQLTRDDSVLAKLLDSGAITVEETRSHPMRNLLTQSLGTRQAVEVQISRHGLVSRDRLLVSSDGLHAIVGDDAIRDILASTPEPEVTVQKLVTAALDCGGPDNISCIVIDYQ